MDSNDRPEPNVPAIPTRSSLPRPAALESALFGASAANAEPTRSVNLVKAALRAISRHWWQILLLWAIGAGAACFVINLRVQPLYRATSVLKVEPTRQGLFDNGPSPDTFAPYLETQVQLMTSPNVLSVVISDPNIARLPIVAESKDPEAELKRQLKVTIVPGSYLLQVAMTSTSADEASKVVNAVVDSFLKATADWSDGMTKNQIRKLEDYQRQLRTQAEEKESAWLELAGKSDIDMDSPELIGMGQPGQSLPVPSRSRVTIEQYKKVREELFRINIDLGQAEALLAMRESEAPKPKNDSDEKTQRKIDLMVQADPEVNRLWNLIEQTQKKHDDAKRRNRNGADPSVVKHKKDLAELNQKYEQLVAAKREHAQLILEEQNGFDPGKLVRDQREKVESLKASKATFEKMLSSIEVANKKEGTDAVKVALVREALQGTKQMVDTVEKRLEQLRFEQTGGEARIVLISPARPSATPDSDNRVKLLVATPLFLLFLLTGLFVMLEVKIGRVSDIEDLSKQLPVEVFAVPQLPGPRLEPGQRGAKEREGRLQEFLQSLDHLRVALCDEESASGAGRCMVITSATGGEGKTTLSAQLAACCAKAGVATLVIDADMRRATLSRMLNEEKTPGLSDVLQGDLTPDDAYVAVSDAGFHLLPAGTTGRDPSWLLKGQRIGQLLTRYRQTFDLILIDTPPVLPVPDALTIARWTDGAVLATRFDVSRLPLVERARRRLSSAGIPLLKTVVNGVKTSRFYYGYAGYYSGGYGYGYGGGYGYGYGAYGGDRERAVGSAPSAETTPTQPA